MGRQLRRRRLTKREFQRAYHWLYKSLLSPYQPQNKTNRFFKTIKQIHRASAVRPKESLPFCICQKCGAIGSNLKVRIRRQKIIISCRLCNQITRKVISSKRKDKQNAYSKRISCSYAGACGPPDRKSRP